VFVAGDLLREWTLANRFCVSYILSKTVKEEGVSCCSSFVHVLLCFRFIVLKHLWVYAVRGEVSFESMWRRGSHGSFF